MLTTPQARTDVVADLLAKVEGHPMCGSLENVDGAFVVMYPAGDFPTDGVRASWAAMGKARALSRLFVRMETDWLASYPAADRVAIAAKINALEKELSL